MPHYDYVCGECQHQQEIFQKITELPLTACPQCQSAAFRRKPGAGGGVLFRCTGFYDTDYNSAKKSEEPSTSKSCCPCGKSSSCSH